MAPNFLSALVGIWLTPGVSEFLAALLGGGITIGAQYVALKHDRKKETERIGEERKAFAWAIYFKISEVNEALSATAKELREAREKASVAEVELWQVLQFPPHDWRATSWDIGELVLLIDHKKFELMQRYQESVLWLSNFIQSAKFYRELRIDFLRQTPSDVQGDRGSIKVGPDNRSIVMPTIAHLRSVANSLETVILSQQPDVRQLMKDYAIAMKEMIGSQPNLEFLDE